MTSRPRRAPSGPVPGQLLPAWLSIPEIAKLSGKHRNSVRRLLEADGMPLARSGRKVVVHTSVLRRRMPELVLSIEDGLMQSTESDKPEPQS